MRYLSVCSGIEAASVAWGPLGWQAAAFSEIDPFPRAVLAHRFPHVPLHGDFTTIKGAEYGPVDLLVGGTPCQSFSVAGLRGGLADDRGNLTLEFLKLAERTKAQWIVWENVPGVISDKTKALEALLDGMEELGYIVDIDILDAQYFGVPQRRRRVFVCGQHRDALITEKTDSSALTIAQCLLEILHGILAEASRALGSAQASSASAYLSRDGALRRMKLFGLLGAESKFPMLRANLIAALQRCRHEQGSSDASRGASARELIPGVLSMGSREAGRFTLTEQSLSEALEGACEVMKSFTTSTRTSTITTSQIYTCSQAVLLIARLIQHLNPSCPPFWSAASSALTALEGFTNYARQASSDLFADLGRVHAWFDFIGEAERSIDAIADIGVECFGQVLSVSDSLQGHPAPRREAGARVAALTSSGVGTCGADDNQAQAGHLVAFGGDGGVANCITSHERKGPDSDCTTTLIAHTIRGDGFDASEDGTGRGTPLVPVSFAWQQGGAQGMAIGNDVSITLIKNQSPAVMHSAVRRLTPTECERLQGFPDGWTDVPYRGKPAADGPRYKALGNSMAVPCMAWIGHRIAAVEAIIAKREAAA